MKYSSRKEKNLLEPESIDPSDILLFRKPNRYRKRVIIAQGSNQSDAE